MKPGERVERWTVGAERPGGPDFREWEAEPEAELLLPKPHLRLRPGFDAAFCAFVPPVGPTLLPELWRGMAGGEPVLLRARSRPLRREEGDAAVLAWVGPTLDAWPELGPEDLRVDAEGVVRVAHPGLPAHEGLRRGDARGRVAAWLGLPASTPPSADPARVRAPLRLPRPAPATRVLIASAGEVERVAILAAVPPERVAEAFRRRQPWAVEGHAGAPAAERRAGWMGRRGVPVEVVELGAAPPSFWPALGWTALGQGALVFDGSVETAGLVVGTMLGAGTLVRAVRRLAPWQRSREAAGALRNTEQLRVAGPARSLVELLGALPAGLPELAASQLRDALEAAQEALLDGGEPAELEAALREVVATLEDPGALAPAVNRLGRATAGCRKRAPGR